MYCDVCGRTNGHLDGCPENNYIPTSKYKCEFCNEPILDGEKYVDNQCNEYAHYDCVYGDKETIEWLGGIIREMEDCNER